MHDDEKNLSERDRRVLQGLRIVLRNPEASQFLWWVLEICGIYRSGFTGNSSTYFIEGQRDVGLKIVQKILDVSPRAYAQLQLAMASQQEEIDAIEANKAKAGNDEDAD